MLETITDSQIYQMLEAVLIDDAVVTVTDAHNLMIALRNHYDPPPTPNLADPTLAAFIAGINSAGKDPAPDLTDPTLFVASDGLKTLTFTAENGLTGRLSDPLTFTADSGLKISDGASSLYFRRYDKPADTGESILLGIVQLRDAFFQAVPDSHQDTRFAECMGSPSSVLYYVTKYLLEARKP